MLVVSSHAMYALSAAVPRLLLWLDVWYQHVLQAKVKALVFGVVWEEENAPKHKVMKALRMRRRMNFSESRKVALWWGNEEAPGERVGILRPESGNRAGVVIFWWLEYGGISVKVVFV